MDFERFEVRWGLGVVGGGFLLGEEEFGIAFLDFAGVYD